MFSNFIKKIQSIIKPQGNYDNETKTISAPVQPVIQPTDNTTIQNNNTVSQPVSVQNDYADIPPALRDSYMKSALLSDIINKSEPTSQNNYSNHESTPYIDNSYTDIPPALRDSYVMPNPKPTPTEVVPKINMIKAVFDESTAYGGTQTFFAIDTETTGLNSEKDKIIEISVVKFQDGKETKNFSTLINPEIPIPEEATKINNITDDMVKTAPKLKEAMNDFWNFILENQSDDVDILLCAHNADFDISFIKSASQQAEIKIEQDIFYVDTLQIARKYLKKKIRNYKLGTILKYFDIVNENAHRAESDAISCGKIYVMFSNKLLEIYEKDYDVTIKLIGTGTNKIQDNLLSHIDQKHSEVNYRYNSVKEKYEIYYEHRVWKSIYRH